MRVLLIVLLSAIPTFSQTVSPVITQDHPDKKGIYKGQFTFTADSLKPVSVSIKVETLSMSNGRIAYHPLPKNIHVDLSDMSAIVGAAQTHAFDYKIRCEQLPCVIGFYSSYVTGRTNEGLEVRVEVPTLVYLCEKSEKHCRDKVRASWGMPTDTSVAKTAVAKTAAAPALPH